MMTNLHRHVHKVLRHTKPIGNKRPTTVVEGLYHSATTHHLQCIINSNIINSNNPNPNG